MQPEADWLLIINNKKCWSARQLISQAHFRFPGLKHLQTGTNSTLQRHGFPKLSFFHQKSPQTNISGFGTITWKTEGLPSPQLYCFQNLKNVGRMREKKRRKWRKGSLSVLNGMPVHPHLQKAHSENILYKNQAGFMQCMCYLYFDTGLIISPQHSGGFPGFALT